jgi:hypothetical protein
MGGRLAPEHMTAAGFRCAAAPGPKGSQGPAWCRRQAASRRLPLLPKAPQPALRSPSTPAHQHTITRRPNIVEPASACSRPHTPAPRLLAAGPAPRAPPPPACTRPGRRLWRWRPPTPR